MTIGIDENGKRVSPFPDRKATCQICSGVVISKCGEIYDWHWAHRVDQNCDPWKEHETVWHRGWKNKFPFDWREVVITNEDGECHYADVRTDTGMVIEFQNSSISPSTIRIREEFYGDMVWVINAKSFKDNLVMASVVTQKLRPLKLEESDPYVFIEVEYDEKTKALQKQITDWGQKIKPIDEEIHRCQRKIESLSTHVNDIDNLTTHVINLFYRDEYLPSDLREITSGVDRVIEDKIRKLRSEITSATEKIKEDERRLETLRALEDIDINNVTFKKIPFHWLTKENYHKARMVSSESIGSLFLNFETISSELAFDRLKHTNARYIFCYELSQHIATIAASVVSAKDSLKVLEAYTASVREAIKESLIARLQELLSDLDSKMKKNMDESEDMVVEKSKLETRLGTMQMRMAEEIPNAKKVRLKEIQEEKYAVMKKYKGLYDFITWKHERKSWQVANERIFFDTGDGFLLRKLSNDRLLKISFEDFLQDYGNIKREVSVK